MRSGVKKFVSYGCVLLYLQQGLTALYIAQKLGYISVVEVLKNVTKSDKGKHAANEDKYKVVAPETMQENFMSDSEDEGGEYRVLLVETLCSFTLTVLKADRIQCPVFVLLFPQPFAIDHAF